MTVSLTQQARNRRLIALQALHIRKIGADSRVVVMQPKSRVAAPMFTSSRTAHTDNIFAVA